MSKCRTLSHTRTRVLRLNAFFPPSAASSTNAVSGICVAPCGTAQVTECSLKHQNKVARQMDCWESLTGKLLPTEPRVHLHQTCVHLGGQKLISTVIIAPNWVGGLKPGFHQAIDYCFTWNHFESQLRWCNFKKKTKTNSTQTPHWSTASTSCLHAPSISSIQCLTRDVFTYPAELLCSFLC